jgi:hypothetical protein
VTGLRDQQPQRYEICVRGRLGEAIRSAFPALQSRTRGDATTLTGVPTRLAGVTSSRGIAATRSRSLRSVSGGWTMLRPRVDRVVDRCFS